MLKNRFFLSFACLVLSLGALLFPARSAHAQEVGSLYYYPITQEEYRDHYYEWKRFLEYHLHREQCQHYVEPPPGFIMKGCQVYRLVAPAPAPVMTQVEEKRMPLLPVISSYTVYFAFDRSDIRPSEVPTLDLVTREIDRYQPEQVTVSGHADTSGPHDYNVGLSQRRAQSVADALTARGITNQIIDKEAYGETDLAVETGDGVKLEQNRRVVIDFRGHPH